MVRRRVAQSVGGDASAYRRSIAVIGWQVAAVCGVLVLAGGLLAIAYVFWQTTPAKLAEANAPDKVRVFLDPLALTLAGLVVGVGAVLCAGIAAWIIARRAVRPLDEAFRVQRRFVADASHELRTPISVLSARAQQLAAMTPVDDPRQPVIEALRQDARIMSGIVDDMLATATGESVGAESSSLARSMLSAAADLRLLADQFDVVIAAEPLEVELAVPESVLRRCLVALLDNAIDYSPRGATVMMTAQRSGEIVAIDVVDCGPGIVGIAPDRVFDRFAHGAPASTPRGESRTRHGIGLALVRELVERYDGTATVLRTGSDGSTFELVLPVARGGSAA